MKGEILTRRDAVTANKLASESPELHNQLHHPGPIGGVPEEDNAPDDDAP